MYICKDCKKKFLVARVYLEPRGDTGYPYERFLLCPYCSSNEIEKTEMNYCKCCGAKLPEDKKDFCNNRCRVRGQKMWIREQRRRRKMENDPLFETVLKVDTYNKEHGTKYSYGQFVALVLPKLLKEKRRNGFQ